MTGFIQVDVDKTGSDRFLSHLETIISGPSLAVFLAGPASEYVRLRASERFAKEGDEAVGGRWHPLKPVTIAIRTSGAVNYGAGPINHRTGELERFITSDANATVHAVAEGADLTLPGQNPTGELFKKLETAQQGKRFPQTVARPVLGLSANDALVITNSLQEYIVRMGNAI